jgi:hypothetical protein
MQQIKCLKRNCLPLHSNEPLTSNTHKHRGGKQQAGRRTKSVNSNDEWYVVRQFFSSCTPWLLRDKRAGHTVKLKFVKIPVYLAMTLKLTRTGSECRWNTCQQPEHRPDSPVLSPLVDTRSPYEGHEPSCWPIGNQGSIGENAIAADKTI